MFLRVMWRSLPKGTKNYRCHRCNRMYVFANRPGGVAMPDKVGQQIGNYRLIQLLGSGGFADVYLGQHVHLASKQAAVKVLHLFDVDVQKFKEEAETTEKLVHPHIVRILDFGIDRDNAPYLIMEYASHGTLRTRHPSAAFVKYGNKRVGDTGDD